MKQLAPSSKSGRPAIIESLRFSSTILLLLIAGCTPELNHEYGTTRGQSINGINSFVSLIKKTGHKVDVWSGVAAEMQFEYQTLILFHSQYDKIDTELTGHLQTMIDFGNIQRLIIVARDSDLSVDYWKEIEQFPSLKPEERNEAREELNRRRAQLVDGTSSEVNSITNKWYGLSKVDRSNEPLTRTVVIESEDESKSITARWPLYRRLQPAEHADVLWSSGDDPLLTVEKSGMVELFVLASATPLLNGGFADSGNRQLATDLVEMIPADDRVAIVRISRWIDAGESESPGIWRFLKVHPNGWVFGQAIFALLLFCWWKLPIFGRPIRMISSEPVRFGRHVEALGFLLQRSRNREFARQRIHDWIDRESKTPAIQAQTATDTNSTTNHQPG